MSKKEVTVESFELDHTIVKAPYIRLISQEKGPVGDVISNFDVRLVQPNENAIPTAGLHTIEHLFAKLIRERIDGMIDCSPFGCRTGFHLMMWGEHNTTEIAQVIKSSPKKSLMSQLGMTSQVQPLNLAETTRTTVFLLQKNGQKSFYKTAFQTTHLNAMSSKITQKAEKA